MVFYVNELILQDIAICKEIRIRLHPHRKKRTPETADKGVLRLHILIPTLNDVSGKC